VQICCVLEVVVVRDFVEWVSEILFACRGLDADRRVYL
jgi:hypothetical protein